MILSEFYSDDARLIATVSKLDNELYRVQFKEDGVPVGHRTFYHMFEAEEAAENYVLGE